MHSCIRREPYAARMNVKTVKWSSTMINRICRPGTDAELKVHDGIIGAFTLATVVAGVMVNPAWFWLTGLTGVVMFSSAFTGFCPLHFLLSKIMPAPDSASDGTT
jgi:hypothetical protein